MSLLKRVFSADYRRALAAEATGDYLEAARGYALAGEDTKVAEMHLLSAARASGESARLAELRAAARWAREEDAASLALRRRIARAMCELTGHGVVASDGAEGEGRPRAPLADAERSLLREAAALLVSAGDDRGAGDCFERAGDEQAAADAYQRAGEVERLERLLSRVDHRGRERRDADDAFFAYEVALAAGRRDEALARLRQAIAIKPTAALCDLERDLVERRIARGRVALRDGEDAAPVLYLGRFPVALGREPSCELPLPDPRVSRRHAAISLDATDARFVLRDLAARNGTRLGGLRLERGGEVPLAGEGEIGLGDDFRLAYRVNEDGPRLALTVAHGDGKGRAAIASPAPIALAGGAATLAFDDGRPMLAAAAGCSLRLGGALVGERVQLVAGDVVVVERAGAAAARLAVER